MATQILKTVKPTGGDYSSLAQAIAGNAQDLVANDKYLSIEIDGDWSGGPDTSTVNITGYTTDVTHYIEIYTSAACRHPGYYSTSKYRLEVNSPYSYVLALASSFVTLTGLQIKNTNTTDGYKFTAAVYLNSGTSNVINACLIYSDMSGVFSNVDGPEIDIRNSVLYSTRGAAASITCYGDITTKVIRNCILISKGGTSPTVETVYTDSSYRISCQNCYGYNGGSGVVYITDSVVPTTSASSDATGSTGLQSIAYSSSSGALFTNVTLGFEDFSIKAGSPLIDVGTDLSAVFTTDIYGNTRTGTWDIGIANTAFSSSSSSSCSSSSSSSCRSSSSSSRSSSSSSSSSCRSSSSSSSSCRSSSSSSSSCSSSSSSSSRSSSSSCRSSSSSSNSRSSSSSSCRSSSSSSSSRSVSSSSSSCRSSSSSSSSSSCRSSSSSSCSSSSSRSSSSSSSSCRSSSSSSSSCRSSLSSSSSAYLGTSKNYSREDVSGLPSGTTDLATVFSGGELIQVQFLDNVRVAQTTINTHACFLFKDRFTADIPFTVSWIGQSNKACTVSPIVLQIYNRTSGLWETLDQNTTSPANTNVTLQGFKLSTIANYFDANHEIDCRVYQQAV